MIPPSLLSPWNRWWHHYNDVHERLSVSNHTQHGCLLKKMLKLTARKTQILILLVLCAGNPPVTVGYLSQMASISESVSMPWRHHDQFIYQESANTVRCRYNAVNFLINIHKGHSIARPLGRGMGCILWIQHLFDILPQFLQLFMQYLTILDRVIVALDCI